MHDVQQSQESIVTILIAEANRMNCQLVEEAFRSRRNRMAIVGSAIESIRALDLLKQIQPDIAIVSAQLQEGPFEGYRLLRDMRALQTKTRAIMLLDSRDREPVIDAFRSGAHGVIFRDEPIKTLGKCIHAVHQGQVWANSQHLGYVLDALSHAMPFRFRDARGLELLSKREQDVVKLVAEGMANKEISARLGLTGHSVRNYIFRIFDKVGVSTRVELVLYCLQERQYGSSPRSD